MQACAAAGYPVRAVVMPIIPIEDWKHVYGNFLEQLLTAVPLNRITLGGTCIYKPALQLVQLKLGKDNAISNDLQPADKVNDDGRSRYSHEQRVEIYRVMVQTIKRIQPKLQIGLCLEHTSVFEDLGMKQAIGQCNCLL
ncbi:MAG TPA: hypothetical protein DCM28_20965 [Phycisphaerales bacterium]|nr:hypothetical protein [Phycisphaerales bacterium]